MPKKYMWISSIQSLYWEKILLPVCQLYFHKNRVIWLVIPPGRIVLPYVVKIWYGNRCERKFPTGNRLKPNVRSICRIEPIANAVILVFVDKLDGIIMVGTFVETLMDPQTFWEFWSNLMLWATACACSKSRELIKTQPRGKINTRFTICNSSFYTSADNKRQHAYTIP